MIPIVASADDIDAAVAYGNNHTNARWYIGKRLDALDEVGKIPTDWPETAPIVAARLPKLGTGKRFANLKGQLAKRGVNNPGALAAYIGRKKFGAKKFGKLSAHGRTAAAVTAAVDEAVEDDGTQTMDRSQAGQPTVGWIRRVRSEIAEAGIDPDYVEATVPGGFTSNFDGTDAVTYAEALIKAYADSIADEFPELLEGDPTHGESDDDDQVDGDTAQADPADAGQGAPAADAPAAAGVPAMTASGAGVVNFYGGVSPEALTAAVRGVVKEELKTLTAALPPRHPDDEDQSVPDAVDPDGDGDDDSVPGGPGDTDMDGGTGVPDSVPPAGPDGGAPVDDLDGKKAALRARLGRGVSAAGGYGAPKQPAVTPVGAPAAPPASTTATPASIPGPPRKRPVMAAGAMRARLAEAGGQGNS